MPFAPLAPRAFAPLAPRLAGRVDAVRDVSARLARALDRAIRRARRRRARRSRGDRAHPAVARVSAAAEGTARARRRAKVALGSR